LEQESTLEMDKVRGQELDKEMGMVLEPVLVEFQELLSQ
jgi:hypothetical protein